ncbi:LysR family transcriptional regulator [Brenneria uluponensis]|uniref:LysR family transcriptional regulator n=1 Tax=Brenneria uluponensis TaxID=3057057 RepID=UPI0028EEE062|nr:LysR family transcriptional regulator [Brenneria ulupoensis]
MFAFSRFLLYFTEVARQGSFRKASETLHVAASSIDRQILRVEEELEMPLFERHPAGLRLTAAGELLLNAANNWKKDFSRVRDQLDDLRGLRRGHVRIATIDAINRGFFSSMLKKIHLEYPNVSFTLTTMNNIDIQQALISGDVDFGIMLNPQSSKALQVQSFAEINLGIVVPQGHPLAGRDRIRFNQCLDYPFIIPSAPLMLAEPVQALLNINGGSVNEVGISNNIHMIRSLIKEQIGIGILCWLDIMDEVQRGELMFIPLSDPQLKPFTLSLCVAPARQLSIAASMMLKRLEMLFSQLQTESR